MTTIPTPLRYFFDYSLPLLEDGARIWRTQYQHPECQILLGLCPPPGPELTDVFPEFYQIPGLHIWYFENELTILTYEIRGHLEFQAHPDRDSFEGEFKKLEWFSSFYED